MIAESFEMIPAFYLAIPFFLLLIFINWLGYRFKIRYIRKFPGIDHVGIGPTEGSLLGLTALLLSFTFGMSATKYELRRQHFISEITDIETTILRADMYPDSIKNSLRSDLNNYVDTRIEYYAAGDNEARIAKSIELADSISHNIWERVAHLSQNPTYLAATQQMVPAVNSMIDMVTTREGGRKAVVPRMVLIILCLLILVSAFLSGYGSKNLERNKVLVFAFAFITTVALYLVLDLDRPRQGFVNLNSAQQMMVNLKNHF